MKEFFSKKWVFITSVAAAAVFVVGLLVMLCVPRFYVGSYYGVKTYETTKYESYITFKSGNQFEVKQVKTNTTTGQKTETIGRQWYYKDGNIIVALGDTNSVTKELYEKEVEAIKALEKDAYDAYIKTRGLKCNLRYMTSMDDEQSERYSNKTSIAFIVINVVLAAASLAAAGYATWLFVKDKKATPAVKENPEVNSAE